MLKGADINLFFKVLAKFGDYKDDKEIKKIVDFSFFFIEGVVGTILMFFLLKPSLKRKEWVYSNTCYLYLFFMFVYSCLLCINLLHM